MTAKVQPGQSEEAVGVTPKESADAHGVSRRTILRVGGVAGGGVAVATAKGLGGFASADSAFALTSVALGDGLFYIENFPTSPLILAPFTDALPIPKALGPIPRSVYSTWTNPPGPGVGQQNSLRNQQHQIWPSRIPAIGDWAGGVPDPRVYQIDVMLGTHSVTTSQVLPIHTNGLP